MRDEERLTCTVRAGMRDEDRLTYTVPEAAQRLGIATSTTWKHIGSGRIPVLRLGGRTLVTRAAVEALLAEGAAAGMPAAPRPLRRMRMS